MSFTDDFANSPAEVANTLKTFLQAKKELQTIYIPQAEEYYKDQKEHIWENYSFGLQGDYNDVILQTQRRIISLLINIKEVTLLRDNGVRYRTSIAEALGLIKKVAQCKVIEHTEQAHDLDMVLASYRYSTYIYKTSDNRVTSHLYEQLNKFPDMIAKEEAVASTTHSLAVEIDEMMERAIEELANDLEALQAELVTCKNDLNVFTKELADTLRDEKARAAELASRLALLEEFKLWLSYVEKDYKYVFDTYPKGFEHILNERMITAARFGHISSMYPNLEDSRPKGGRNGRK